MITSRTAVVALAVTSVSAAVLAGCSSDSGSSNGSGKIAFIQGVSGDEFYISMQCGIEAAAESAGITVDTQGPAKFDPTLQKPIVDSVVASRPSAILIAPTDVAAMQAPSPPQPRRASRSSWLTPPSRIRPSRSRPSRRTTWAEEPRRSRRSNP